MSGTMLILWEVEGSEDGREGWGGTVTSSAGSTADTMEQQQGWGPGEQRNGPWREGEQTAV